MQIIEKILLLFFVAVVDGGRVTVVVTGVCNTYIWNNEACQYMCKHVNVVTILIS